MATKLGIAGLIVLALGLLAWRIYDTGGDHREAVITARAERAAAEAITEKSAAEAERVTFWRSESTRLQKALDEAERVRDVALINNLRKIDDVLPESGNDCSFAPDLRELFNSSAHTRPAASGN